jgi:hypothetical protein
MVRQSFTWADSGHESLLALPKQVETEQYAKLKEQYINILQAKKLIYEVDKIDNRRTIEVVKNNRLTIAQLEALIAINKQ